jgi:hypothetical protein
VHLLEHPSSTLRGDSVRNGQGSTSNGKGLTLVGPSGRCNLGASAPEGRILSIPNTNPEAFLARG